MGFFMPDFMATYSGSIVILLLAAMSLGTLLIIVPKLLRMHQRSIELQHEQHMRSLEQHIPVPPSDDLARAASRTAALLPMVVIVATSIVTCFLVTYRPGEVFAVTLAIWCVSGVVSLTAITGGVALMGRLAYLRDEESEEWSEAPSDK